MLIRLNYEFSFNNDNPDNLFNNDNSPNSSPAGCHLTQMK